MFCRPNRKRAMCAVILSTKKNISTIHTALRSAGVSCISLLKSVIPQGGYFEGSIVVLRINAYFLYNVQKTNDLRRQTNVTFVWQHAI